jgi:hypothetical protein
MSTIYGLIQNYRVHELFELDRELGEDETPQEALNLAAGIDVRLVGSDVMVGYVVDGEGQFLAPGHDSEGSVKSKAGVLLSDSDRVVLRCVESAVSVPKSWIDYRASLRGICATGLVETWPRRPPYPKNESE